MHLLLLGPLDRVNSLNITLSDSTSLVLTWEPPFTLNISDNKDIDYYRVEVINASSMKTLHEESVVNATHFNYIRPQLSWCFITLFTVTAFNVVGEGAPNTVRYFGADMGKLMSVQESSILKSQFTLFSL